MILMEYTILAMIILGSVLSQILPYFRKVSEGKIKEFDFKYAYNTLVSAFWSSVLAIPVYAGTWTIPSGFSDTVIVHFLALLFGYGGQKLQLEGIKYINLFRSAKEVVESKSS